jgi:hypothetical protein
MLSIALEGAEAQKARFDGLPAAIQSAVLATSAALAQQVLTLARQKAGGPANSNDRVVTRIFSNGDLKHAAIQAHGGEASPHDILAPRAKALASMVGGGSTIVPQPDSGDPARSHLESALVEMAAQIDAQIKAAALDALAKHMER